jgi:Glyoxalase superfamily protein
VSRGDLVLHLSEHHGDGSPGARLRVMMRGVEEFPREISAKTYRYMRPGLEKTPWGTLETGAIDPFGNLIRFLRADRRAVILTAKDHVPRQEITRRARFFRYLRSIAHAAAPTLAFSRRAASTSKAVPFSEVRKAPPRGPKEQL